MPRECGECAFFFDGEVYGECRRSPPVRLPRRFTHDATPEARIRSEEVFWDWPSVNKSDWCGEFSPASDVRSKIVAKLSALIQGSDDIADVLQAQKKELYALGEEPEYYQHGPGGDVPVVTNLKIRIDPPPYRPSVYPFRIKRLEWTSYKPTPRSKKFDHWAADTPVGSYSIQLKKRYWIYYDNVEIAPWQDTLENAQNLAQVDFEDRIRRSLEEE